MSYHTEAHQGLQANETPGCARFWSPRIGYLSRSSKACFRSSPPAYPIREPSFPITRWQGMTTEMGFRPTAAPTARTACRLAESTRSFQQGLGNFRAGPSTSDSFRTPSSIRLAASRASRSWASIAEISWCKLRPARRFRTWKQKSESSFFHALSQEGGASSTLEQGGTEQAAVSLGSGCFSG